MRATRSTIAALLLAASATACESDLGGPRSIREVVGVLVSPNGPEGAVVLDIRGRGIGAIEADSAQIFIARDGPDLRVILIREVPGAIRFRLRVVDTRAVFDARVVAAANGANEPRGDVDGYRVAWAR